VDADDWVTVQGMPLPRHGIGAGVVGNRIFVPGGGPVEGYGTTEHSDFFEVAQDIVLPQFVVGGGYRSEIVVSNPASRPAALHVSLRDIAGNPLETLLDGEVRGEMMFSLAPLASRRILAPDASGPLRAGTIRIGADVRVNAFGVVRISGGPATTVYPAGASRTAMFQARRIRGEFTNTGLAISNPGGDTASVVLTLVDGNGAEVSRIEHALPAGGQLSRFIDEFFAALQNADFVGTVTVRSTQPISVVALAFGPDGVIAAPVVPIE
jgi:hypothetical protein